MNFNLKDYFNPKVVAAAFTAAVVGGLMGAGIALAQGADTPKALGLAVGAAFLTGAATGLSGWAKSQGNWTPN